MAGEMTLSAARTGEVTKKTFLQSFLKDASTPGSRELSSTETPGLSLELWGSEWNGEA